MPNLQISSEKVCFLIVKAREFDVQDVDTDEDEGSNPSARSVQRVEHPGGC